MIGWLTGFGAVSSHQTERKMTNRTRRKIEAATEGEDCIEMLRKQARVAIWPSVTKCIPINSTLTRGSFRSRLRGLSSPEIATARPGRERFFSIRAVLTKLSEITGKVTPTSIYLTIYSIPFRTPQDPQWSAHEVVPTLAAQMIPRFPDRKHGKSMLKRCFTAHPALKSWKRHAGRPLFSTTACASASSTASHKYFEPDHGLPYSTLG